MAKKGLINFLVWNIANNNVEQNIINLVSKYNPDIIVLIESKLNVLQLISKINKLSRKNFSHSESTTSNHRITIISKFTDMELSPTQDFNEKITIRKLNIKGYKEIIIGFVHLISKMAFDNSSRAFEAIRYSNHILNEEVFANHERTIIMGDFNMNPFADGIMSVMAFNAVVSREIARKRTRIVQGQEYKYFYNPMWHFFGDIDKTPLGTFYFPSPDHVNYSWNIFDQVLVRPDLIDCVKYDKLKILDNDGVVSLLKNGKPDKNSYSDHLPISFTIDLGEIK